MMNKQNRCFLFGTFGVAVECSSLSTVWALSEQWHKAMAKWLAAYQCPAARQSRLQILGFGSQNLFSVFGSDAKMGDLGTKQNVHILTQTLHSQRKEHNQSKWQMSQHRKWTLKFVDFKFWLIQRGIKCTQIPHNFSTGSATDFFLFVCLSDDWECKWLLHINDHPKSCGSDVWFLDSMTSCFLLSSEITVMKIKNSQSFTQFCVANALE